jgi:glucokinase
MINQIISWDLGATKCMAGLMHYENLNKKFISKRNCSIKLKNTHSLYNLIEQLETELNFSFNEADAICIGAAGHYDGRYLTLANPYPYPMPFYDAALKARWQNFSIIHDYASIVCATFTSYMEQQKNIKRLNSSISKPHGRRIALGIGTGLGLKDGILFSDGDFWLGQNEIGHIGIPTPPTAAPFYLNRHQAMMDFLNRKFSCHPITFEKILSGNGIVNLYEFFYPDSPSLTAPEIGYKMQQKEMEELKRTFAWYLGLLIGTVQLSFMPEGGIWITGGVILNNLDIFDYEDFFSGIHASPAYLTERQDYPLGVLCDPEHAMFGNAYYAVKRLLPKHIGETYAASNCRY